MRNVAVLLWHTVTMRHYRYASPYVSQFKHLSAVRYFPSENVLYLELKGLFSHDRTATMQLRRSMRLK